MAAINGHMAGYIRYLDAVRKDRCWGRNWRETEVRPRSRGLNHLDQQPVRVKAQTGHVADVQLAKLVTREIGDECVDKRGQSPDTHGRRQHEYGM